MRSGKSEKTPSRRELEAERDGEMFGRTREGRGNGRGVGKEGREIEEGRKEEEKSTYSTQPPRRCIASLSSSVICSPSPPAVAAVPASIVDGV